MVDDEVWLTFCQISPLVLISNFIVPAGMLYSRNPRISFAPIFSAKRPNRRRIPLQFGAKWMAAPVSLANWDCSKSWKVSVSSDLSSLVASTYCHFMALLTQCDSRGQTSNSSTCNKDFQRRFGLGLFLDSHFYEFQGWESDLADLKVCRRYTLIILEGTIGLQPFSTS